MSLISKILVAILAVSSVAEAGVIDLGEYNVFVRENFEVSSSDTQGRSAIGGDLIVNGQYNLGTLLDGQRDNLQVVGGDIVKTQADKNLQVQGVVEYSGKIQSSDNNLNGRFVSVDTPRVDFDQSFAQFDALSKSLAAMESTGHMSRPWSSRLEFQANTSTASPFQVFNVNANDLQGINELAFSNNTNGHQVVINIFGELDYNIGSIVKWNINRSDVLLHFVDATTLHLNRSVHASIFAPNTDIISHAGEVKGQIVANSWKALAPTQINQDRFRPVEFTDNSVPPPPAPPSKPTPPPHSPTVVEVAEPKTLFMFLSSLVLLTLTRRFS